MLTEDLMATVHIVDDDASVRTAISRVLQGAGYDVAVYESAEQLLARLPELSEPGCILLDVVMPGLSGPELQDRLRKLGSALPIVFVTGSEEPIERAATDSLIKPFSMDKLLEAIEDALRGARTAE
jgi:FixJ family two-component response regulator